VLDIENQPTEPSGQAASPARLGHVAIRARDPERVADFYRELLDLQIVRQASNPLVGDAALLSGDPAREDHELVLVSNDNAQHIAFRVDSPEQLRTLYARAKRQGLQIPYALDSGVAVGFFVRDPEGNAVEVYLPRSGGRSDRPPLTDPDLIDHLILSDSRHSFPGLEQGAA
jgi:catechol-2,3-dioxygenase